MRFGLFGTGPWAIQAPGPALAAHRQAELVGVWGRDPAKAGALAAELDTRAYAEVDDLLADVDAISVALPPAVQAPLAIRAARAGRHLLLDKPVAMDLAGADSLLTEVISRGLASVVFFTRRFQPAVAEMLRETGETAWSGGRAVMHASIFRTGSPFGASPWRREHGGLWDVGPHALSLLLPALGPVTRVAAMPGPHDTVEVLLQHAGGAVSTMSLTLDAPPEATIFQTVLYGPTGPVTVPDGGGSVVEAFGRAIDALIAQAGASGPAPAHPCDVRLGRDVVAVLAAAGSARTDASVVRVPAAPDVSGPPAAG